MCENPVEKREAMQPRVYKGADRACVVFGGGECARQQRAVLDGKAKSVTLPAKTCRNCLRKVRLRFELLWQMQEASVDGSGH